MSATMIQTTNYCRYHLSDKVLKCQYQINHLMAGRSSKMAIVTLTNMWLTEVLVVTEVMVGDSSVHLKDAVVRKEINVYPESCTIAIYVAHCHRGKKRAGEEFNDYSYWPGSWPSKDTNKLAHISAQAIDTVPFASGRFKLLAPGCPLRYGKQLSGEHNDCGIWGTQHTLNVQPWQQLSSPYTLRSLTDILQTRFYFLSILDF